MSTKPTPIKKTMTPSLQPKAGAFLPETNACVFLKAAQAMKPNSSFKDLWETAQELVPYLKPIEKEVRQVTQPGGIPWTVIQNLPIDEELPPTPTDGKRPNDKGWVSELVLLAVLHIAGLLPLAFEQEKNGQIIHEIAPVPGLSHTQSNSGRVPLSWHADLGHLQSKYRPEFLLLLGLRNPAETKTWIAPIEEITEKLQRQSPDSDRILRQSRYRPQSPDSFNYNGNLILSKSQPLISTNEEGYDEVVGNLSNIQALDDEAKAALETLKNLLKPPIAKSVILKPGSLLLFNNLRCLHARDAVFSDRWLQRVYGRNSLNALRSATGSNGYVFDSCLIALS
ncbi:TauD/TfdA family dioxygenase [Planktothrix sp. FACHB-1365]|uniref:TauD/TfdA family dioxygenase n=1 Tax=Planktothrix sp. FACHB-1365 TaxID=2692855 RepID=UPI001684DC7B|nr:TauD/TfdA family dioxygenase [Planktothrix sp. FACHB-1365]MBD2485597.1 TauD/TfdA family dioxygenase [Planktothrix sp. FACHB-1365]